MYIGLVSRLVRKGEVLFYSSVYINNGTKNFEVKVDVQKGALRFRENLKLEFLVGSNSCHLDVLISSLLLQLVASATRYPLRHPPTQAIYGTLFDFLNFHSSVHMNRLSLRNKRLKLKTS